jgi:hypothetical protein
VFIHLQEGICGKTYKRAKNMQKNKAQIPFYTSPKERGPLPDNSGPRQRGE